jgi:methionine-rich copper-binding protein CopC
MILARVSRRDFYVRFWMIVMGIGSFIPSLHAHAKLVRSTPKQGSEVQEAPKTLELWFNELLDDGFNTVEVCASAERGKKDRRNFVKGKPRVDAKDRTRLIAELEELSPGEYWVEYRVLSRDGHSAPGRLTFKVTGKR